MMYAWLSYVEMCKVYGRNDGCLDEVNWLSRHRVTFIAEGFWSCWGPNFWERQELQAVITTGRRVLMDCR